MTNTILYNSLEHGWVEIDEEKMEKISAVLRKSLRKSKTMTEEAIEEYIEEQFRVEEN